MKYFHLGNFFYSEEYIIHLKKKKSKCLEFSNLIPFFHCIRKYRFLLNKNINWNIQSPGYGFNSMMYHFKCE